MDEEDAHLAMVNAARTELGLPPLSEDDMGRITESELVSTPDFNLPESEDSSFALTTNPDKTLAEGREFADKYYTQGLKDSISIYQSEDEHAFINTMMRQNLSPQETLEYLRDEGAMSHMLGMWDENVARDPMYYDNVINNLEVATNMFRTDKDVTLYRGISYIEEDSPGTILTDLGFMSTSLDEDVAAEFSNGGWVMQINYPEGSPFAVIPDEFEEQEVLLPRGMKFRVVEEYEHEEHDSLVWIIVEPVED